MRDPYNNLKVAITTPPAVYSADNTPVTVDLLGNMRGAVAYIAVGVGGITFSGTNKIDFTMFHSDDDSTYVSVRQTDVVGAPAGVDDLGVVKTLSSAHAAATVSRIGYIGGKRYLRVKADFSGTHGTGTPISILVVASGQRVLPVA